MQTLLKLDGQILLFIQDHLRFGVMDGIMRGLTFLGEKGWFWILLILVLLCFKKTRKVGIAALLSLALAFPVANYLVKNLVTRVRPYDALEGLTRLIEAQKDWSFPSGHAAASIATGWALLRKGEKWLGIPAFILALLVSYSRLYVGVHYPTDVLGAMVIAILSAELMFPVANLVYKLVCGKHKESRR